MTIRDLTEQDASMYRELRLRALREHPEAFGTAAADFEAQPLSTIAARLKATPSSFTLGAFIDARYVGTLMLVQQSTRKARHRAHIYGVYVAPEARRQGIARALFAEAIARAKTMRRLEDIVLAVTVTNTGALKLYESLGFKPAWRELRAQKIAGQYLDSIWLRLELDTVP